MTMEMTTEMESNKKTKKVICKKNEINKKNKK